MEEIGELSGHDFQASSQNEEEKKLEEPPHRRLTSLRYRSRSV
jgi:hypothetical protein